MYEDTEYFTLSLEIIGDPPLITAQDIHFVYITNDDGEGLNIRCNFK